MDHPDEPAKEDELADRRVFVLDDERWKQFMAALVSRKDNPKLRKLLSRKRYWATTAPRRPSGARRS